MSGVLDAHEALAAVFMVTHLEVSFGDRSCEVRLVCTAEARLARQPSWPAYDPSRQFGVNVLARGVRALEFKRPLTGRPALEGMVLKSLAGRQFEDLRWELSDMEHVFFHLCCEDVEVSGAVFDERRA